MISSWNLTAGCSSAWREVSGASRSVARLCATWYDICLYQVINSSLTCTRTLNYSTHNMIREPFLYSVNIHKTTTYTVCVCYTCMCVCVYIYIYICRGRERERDNMFMNRCSESVGESVGHLVSQ